MPLILGTNSIKDTGYDVANSCRFNDGDTAYMHKTPGSAGNLDRWTFSAWIKKCSNGLDQGFLGFWVDSSNYFVGRFRSDDLLAFGNKDGGSWTTELIPNAVYRDNSAWYHIVFQYDSGQASSSNRASLWVNGVKETSFAASVYPSQNADTKIPNSGNPIVIGRTTKDSSTYYLDGYMAEVCFIDGTAYTASDFGEFDEDSPTIWKPKDVSGLTFGTNGFYLDFEDSGNLGNDANGGTDLTEVNLAAVDQCTDSPTNNFCTLNSLDNQRQGFTIIEGNTQITATPDYDFITGTMGVSTGKWYWEAKIITIPTLNYIYNGISDHVQWTAGWDLGGEAGQYCLSRVAGKIKAASGSESTYGGSMSANDIQGFALDADNNKFYISNNGAWSDGSGSWDSTTFDAAVGVITIAHATSAIVGASDFWFPAIGNGANNMNMQVNYGNPPYTLSSAVSDENGYGNFEYAPPSGYYALCTKNLAEFG